MREVVALGYVVISAGDLEAWADFGQDGLGLQLRRSQDSDLDPESLLFRMDDRAWRFAVERGDDGGLNALGFEAPTSASLDSLCERLEVAGHPTKESPELATRRGVARLVVCDDPSGVPLEFFCGAASDTSPFVSPTGARFVTGSQGFGHAVISVDDIESSNRFYLDLLGFRLTDIVAFAGMELYFTSPSPRHHSLAYSARPGGAGGQLEHIMIEVDDLDVVGRAQDHCVDQDGVTIRALLGKHTNDQMISFYCVSPSGLMVEYGYGGRVIDDAVHTVGRYESPHIWGHRPTDLRNMEETMRQMAEASKGSD